MFEAKFYILSSFPIIFYITKIKHMSIKK